LELRLPGRPVALLIKLELRRFQVQMVVLGEVFGLINEKKGCRLDNLFLRMGEDKRSVHRGVFHRSIEAASRQSKTDF